MKANELRIGNWISVSTMQGYQDAWVDQITKYSNFEKDRGIPLTEEWLLKFGFEYRNEHRGKGAIMDLKGEKYKSASVAMLYNADRDFVFMTTWHAPMKYVHQLQNLYFALTGSELTIKQTTDAKV